ncbi:MAG: hypothetical protein ACO32I_09620, partial [Candidatus Limnocylindrus sp.]
MAASDAATDSAPPGLGGYMHRMYWQLTIPFEDLAWLHITVLELLACVFGTIIFAKVLPSRARITMIVDATSAYYTLAEESEKSEVLIFAHHAALASERFRVAAIRCDIVHGAGDFNLAGDAASRSKWDVLQAFATALRIRTRRLEVPQACADIYADVLRYAKVRGIRIQAGRRPPETAMSSEARSLLDRVEAATGRDPRVGPSSHGFLSQEVIEHVAHGFLRRLRAAGGGRAADHLNEREARRPPHTTGRSFLASLRATERKPQGMTMRQAIPSASTTQAKTSEPTSMQTALVGDVRLATPTRPRAPAGGERRAQ